MGAFSKAKRSRAFLRIGIAGPSGSGKTYTALRVAALLGQRVAVIDTERGSASLYAGETPDGRPLDFDVLELATFEPQHYIEAIRAAQAERYDVIVVDSLSHAWSGVGGMLEQVDRKAAKSSNGNTFTAWRDVTPQHNALVDALLTAQAHVVFSLRVKTEYVMVENARGKKEPQKVGLAPVFRDGIEYESTLFIDIDTEHVARVSKTRCSALDGASWVKPGPEIARPLLAWLEGADVAPVAPAASSATAEREHHESWAADRAQFCGALGRIGLDYNAVADWRMARGKARPSALTNDQRRALYTALANREHAQRIDLDAWLAKRAAEHAQDEAAEREPGEEG